MGSTMDVRIDRGSLTATPKDRYRILRKMFPRRVWGIRVLLRKSQGFLRMSATPRVKNPQIFLLEMPFAVFRRGSDVSESTMWGRY